MSIFSSANTLLDKIKDYLVKLHSQNKQEVTTGVNNIASVLDSLGTGILKFDKFLFKYDDFDTEDPKNLKEFDLPPGTKSMSIILDTPPELHNYDNYRLQNEYRDWAQLKQRNESLDEQTARAGYQAGSHLRYFIRFGDNYEVFNRLEGANRTDSSGLKIKLWVNYTELSVADNIQYARNASYGKDINVKTKTFEGFIGLYNNEASQHEFMNSIYFGFFNKDWMLDSVGNFFNYYYKDFPYFNQTMPNWYYASLIGIPNENNSMIGFHDDIEKYPHIDTLISHGGSAGMLNSYLGIDQITRDFSKNKESFNVSEGGESFSGAGSVGIDGGRRYPRAVGTGDDDLDNFVKNNRNIGAGLGNTIIGNKRFYYRNDYNPDNLLPEGYGSIRVIYFK